MKWRKAFDRPLPEIKNRGRLSIKYKGTPHVLVYYHGHWYWEAEEFTDFPLHKESLSAIEWLDESPSLPSSSVTGEEEDFDKELLMMTSWIDKIGVDNTAITRGAAKIKIGSALKRMLEYNQSTPVTGESEAIEVIDGYTQLMVDRRSLPKDGQRIKFMTENENWYEGYFVGGDDIFHVSDSQFFFKWHVQQWKAI